MQNRLDGYDLLNDAYAQAITGNPAARDIPYGGAWAPSDALDDDDLEQAALDAAMATGDLTRSLLEMCLEYLEDDPIWQELEEAAGRALRAFAEEMDREAETDLEEADGDGGED